MLDTPVPAPAGTRRGFGRTPRTRSATPAPSAAGAGDPGPDDRLLLDRFAASGDQEAFAALVARHEAMVRRVCRRVLDDDAEAEDAAMDALAALAARATTIPPEVPLAGWLHQAAWRCARTRRQARTLRQRRERPLADGAHPVAPAPAAPPADLSILVEELDRLDPTDRDLVRWCCIDGMAHRDAAARLGLPAGSLHRRLRRALAELRQRLVGRGLPAPAVAGLLHQREAPPPGALRTAYRDAGRRAGGVCAVCAAAAAIAVGLMLAATPDAPRTPPAAVAESPRPAPAPVQAAVRPAAPASPRAVRPPATPTVRLEGPKGVRISTGTETVDGRRVRTWTITMPRVPGGVVPGEWTTMTIRPSPVPEAFRMSYLIRGAQGLLQSVDADAEPVETRDAKGRPVAWMRRELEIRRRADGAWESRVLVGDREHSRWVNTGRDWDQALRIHISKGAVGRVIVADVQVTPR